MVNLKKDPVGDGFIANNYTTCFAFYYKRAGVAALLSRQLDDFLWMRCDVGAREGSHDADCGNARGCL